jgi:hypothetical protein
LSRRAGLMMGIGLLGHLLACTSIQRDGGADAPKDTDFEVHAQLLGRSFTLAPVCCEFDLRVSGDGQAALRVRSRHPETYGRQDQEYSFTVSEAQLAQVRRTISSAEFTNLPRSIRAKLGQHPIYRVLTVRVGERSHRVSLASSIRCEETNNAWVDSKEVTRTCEVWREVRGLITHPDVTME